MKELTLRSNIDNVEKYRKIGPEECKKAITQIINDSENPILTILDLPKEQQKETIKKTIDSAKSLLKSFESARDLMLKSNLNEEALSINKICISLSNAINQIEHISKSENGIESLGFASDLMTLYNLIEISSVANQIIVKNLELQQSPFNNYLFEMHDSWIEKSTDKKAKEIREKWKKNFGTEYKKGAYLEAVQSIYSPLEFEINYKTNESYSYLSEIANLCNQLTTGNFDENLNNIQTNFIILQNVINSLDEIIAKKYDFLTKLEVVENSLSKVNEARYLSSYWKGIISGLEDEKISLTEKGEQIQKRINSFESNSHINIVDYLISLKNLYDYESSGILLASTEYPTKEEIEKMHNEESTKLITNLQEKKGDVETGGEEYLKIYHLIRIANESLVKINESKTNELSYNDVIHASSNQIALNDIYNQLNLNYQQFNEDFQKFEKYFNLAEETHLNPAYSLLPMPISLGVVGYNLSKNISSQIENEDTYKAKIDYFLNEGWLAQLGIEKTRFQEIKDQKKNLDTAFEEYKKAHEEAEKIIKSNEPVGTRFYKIQNLFEKWQKFATELQSLKTMVEDYDLKGTDYILPSIFKTLDLATIPLLITGVGSVGSQGAKFAIKEYAEHGFKQASKAVLKKSLEKSPIVLKSSLIGAGIGGAFAGAAISYNYLIQDQNFIEAVDLFEKDNKESMEKLKLLLTKIADEAKGTGIDYQANELIAEIDKTLNSIGEGTQINLNHAKEIFGKAVLIGFAWGLLSVSPKSFSKTTSKITPTSPKLNTGKVVTKTEESSSHSLPAKYTEIGHQEALIQNKVALQENVYARIKQQSNEIEANLKKVLNSDNQAEYQSLLNKLKEQDEVIKRALKENNQTAYQSALNSYIETGNKLNELFYKSLSNTDINPILLSENDEIGNAMIKACTENKLDDLKNLFIQNENTWVSINHVNPRTRMSALDYAVRNKNYEMVKYLLEKGANITDQTFEYAKTAKDTKIFKLLEENELANLRLTGKEGSEIAKRAIQKNLDDITVSIDNLENYLKQLKGATNSKGKITKQDIRVLHRFWDDLNNISKWETRDGFGKTVALRFDLFDNKAKLSELQDKIIQNIISKLKEHIKSGEYDKAEEILAQINKASNKHLWLGTAGHFSSKSSLYGKNLDKDIVKEISNIRKNIEELKEISKSRITVAKAIDEVDKVSEGTSISKMEEFDFNFTKEEKVLLDRINEEAKSLNWFQRLYRSSKKYMTQIGEKKNLFFDQIPEDIYNIERLLQINSKIKELRKKITDLEKAYNSENITKLEKSKIAKKWELAKAELKQVESSQEFYLSKIKEIDQQIANLNYIQAGLLRKLIANPNIITHSGVSNPAILKASVPPREMLISMFSFNDKIFHGKLINPGIWFRQNDSYRLPTARANLLKSAEKNLFKNVDLSNSNEAAKEAESILNLIKSRLETVEIDAKEGHRNIFPFANKFEQKGQPIQLFQKTHPKAWETKSTWDEVVENTIDWCVKHKDYRPLYNLSDIMIESGLFSPGKVFARRILPWFNKKYTVKSGMKGDEQQYSEIEIKGWKSYMRKVIIPKTIKELDEWHVIESAKKKLLEAKNFYETKYFEVSGVKSSELRVKKDKIIKTISTGVEKTRNFRENIGNKMSDVVFYQNPWNPSLYLRSSQGYPSVSVRTTWKIAKPFVVWGFVYPTLAYGSISAYMSLTGTINVDNQTNTNQTQVQQATKQLQKGDIQSVLNVSQEVNINNISNKLSETDSKNLDKIVQNLSNKFTKEQILAKLRKDFPQELEFQTMLNFYANQAKKEEFDSYFSNEKKEVKANEKNDNNKNSSKDVLRGFVSSKKKK